MVPKDPSAETAPAGLVPAPEGGAFRAFISYSHRDTKIAEWLHKALETYRVPKPLIGRETATGLIAARPGKIFRDRDELEVAADLSGKINAALNQSQFLIVLCSRASAASKWVNQEVINFKRLKGADRIIAVIVDGEPGAAAMPGRETEECFVPALRFKVSPAGELTGEPAEPIAADLRPGKDTKARVCLKVVAGLLGVGLDELIRRDSQRRARFFFYASVAMGCASLLLAYLTIDAIRSRNLAVASQANADRKRAEAEDLIEFLIGDLRTKLEPVGRLDVLDAVGQKALDHFSSLRPEELDDDALARRARALQLLGTIAIGKGNLSEAEKEFGEAQITARVLLDRAPANSQRLYEYGEATAQVGALLFKRGDHRGARESYTQYLDIAKHLNASQEPKPAWQAQLAKAWMNLGIVSSSLLDSKNAIDQLDQALAVFGQMAVRDPVSTTTWRKDIGFTLDSIASIYYRTGNFDKAVEYRQRQVDLYSQALAQDAENKSIKRELITALRTLANISLNFGDSNLAKEKTEQALVVVTSLTDLDPANTEWKADQARILLDLCEQYLELGEAARMSRQLARAEAIARDLSAADPSVLKWQIDLVIRAESMRARYALATGEPQEANRALIALQSKVKVLAEKFPNEPALRDRAALVGKYRGMALKLMGDTGAAEASFASVLASYPANPERFELQAAMTRAMALYNLNRFAEAYPLMQRIRATGFRRLELRDAMKETSSRLGVAASP